MYPDLPKKIKEINAKGIKFLGYVNPYLVNDGELYKEGKEKGYFATKADGSDYLVDFGEFYCADGTCATCSEPLDCALFRELRICDVYHAATEETGFHELQMQFSKAMAGA